MTTWLKVLLCVIAFTIYQAMMAYAILRAMRETERERKERE